MRMWTWIGRNPASAMPIAAPVIASSDSGVPKTRSGPYFSTSPRVVPWIAFGSSTSSPNTITEESRAISWSVASRTASTKERVRSSPGPLPNPSPTGRRAFVFSPFPGREGGWGVRFRLLSLMRGEGISFLLEDVAHEFGRVGERARLGEREGIRQFLFNLVLNAHADAGIELRCQLSDRVRLHPRLAL